MHLTIWTRRASAAAMLGCMLALASCAGSPHSASGGRPGKGMDDEESVASLVRYCEKLRAQGDLVLAAGMCQRALERARTNVTALMNLAQIMEAMSKPRAAATAYRRILVLHSDHAEARYGLGKAYLRLGQYDMAQQQLEAALAYGMSEAKVRNSLGVVKDKQGNHAAAQEIYSSALERFPDDVPLRTNMGLSLVLAGRHGQGLEVLRDVASDPRAGPASRQGLAFAYAVTGDMGAAETVALIDLPADQARIALAHYESLREAGVGAPGGPDPQAAKQPAALPPPEAMNKPVVLMPPPAVATAEFGAHTKKRCVTGVQNPVCAGKI